MARVQRGDSGVSARVVQGEPGVTIPILIDRLKDDSRRLLRNELELARMEVREAVHQAGRGALWLGIAFGVGVVATVSFTVLASTVLGRIFDSLWGGTLLTGALELLFGAWLVLRGVHRLQAPPYSLAQSRAELKETAHWVGDQRREASVPRRAD
jgi:hypothetical protein